MPDNPFFGQIEKNIKSLLVEKNYDKAYLLLQSAIQKYPKDKRIPKLERLINEEKSKQSREKISKYIEKLEPLWEKENYVELLPILKNLIEADPNNEKLKRLYLKAEKKYTIQFEKLQKNFSKKQNQRLENLFNQADYEVMLEELFKLEKANPGNKKVKKITADYRDKLIHKKIEEKQELIYSKKFEAIQNFIQQLVRIDPKNKRIEKLKFQVQQNQLGTQRATKNEFFYESLQHLETLLKLKKYDKAIKVSEELLSIDPLNKTILKIHAKAEKNFFIQTREDSISIIINKQKSLSDDYRENKNNYLKI